MTYWNFDGAKPRQTVVIVICGAANGDDSELVSAVYAIPAQGGCDSEHDETLIGDGEDYMYIDVEQCAKA